MNDKLLRHACPRCEECISISWGASVLTLFGRYGPRKKRYRTYRCKHCFHVWHNADIVGRFTRDMAEAMACIYVRCLSFDQTRSILRAIYWRDVISKPTLIKHCEAIADRLPSLWNVSQWLKPKRSGFYALDGTWLKYRGKDIVLLILLDIETLDIVSYCVAEEENNESYRKLIDPVREEIRNPRGFFCDEDSGLLKMLRDDYPGVPIQLCVFHKYMGVSRKVPFKYKKKDPINQQVKILVEKVLFATTRVEAEIALVQLKLFALKNHAVKKVQQALAVISQNYELLMTHFEHADMNDRYNNALEGFNAVVKRKTRLMKGFEKEQNIDRWIKLILLDWRFHPLNHSRMKERRGKSPLELSGCDLPDIPNWITYLRKEY